MRPARKDDAEKRCELPTALTVTYEPDRAAFDQNLPRLIESKREALLVEESEGGVVGYAMAAESMTLYANGPVVDLLELIVEERLRSQGIGERLVEAVKAWGLERGCRDLNVASRRSGGYYERSILSPTTMTPMSSRPVRASIQRRCQRCCQSDVQVRLASEVSAGSQDQPDTEVWRARWDSNPRLPD